MPRDLRARLHDEIAESQNNVLTHVHERETAEANRDLNMKRITRAKLMLAALDGEENEYSSMLIQLPELTTTVEVTRPWWKFWQPKPTKGATCPAPSYTSTPPSHTGITPLPYRRGTKSAH